MAKKHGKETVVLVDGYDVTGQSSALDVTNAMDTQEVTAFGDQQKSYVVGAVDGKISQKGFLTDGTAEAHDVLRQRIGSAVVFLAHYGTVTGAYGWGGSAELNTAYGVSGGAGAPVTFSADYNFGLYGGQPIKMMRCHAEGAGTRGAGTANETPSNAGARAFLHILSISSGTPTVALQHGTASTEAAFSNLASFGAVAAAPYAAGTEVTGTVRQYLRAVVTGGTCTYALGYRRL